MLNVQTKINDMNKVRQYRESLKVTPQLKHLFLELTLRCNEKCLHCGSSCGDVHSEDGVLHSIVGKEDENPEEALVCF